MTTANQSSLSLSVQTVFNSITSRYDFLNTFLSFGLDRLWRRRMVACMKFFRTNKYLDLASGTADIALRCVRRYPATSVLAVDFAPAMVEYAKKKIEKEHAQQHIEVVLGDALSLNIEARSFDCTGMAFGIRNIPDKLAALKEMQRVTAIGGKVLILELTLPERFLARQVYRFFLCNFMPHIARLFTRESEAYRYLARSILAFPDNPTFLSLMTSAGFSDVSAQRLSFGACTLYSGTIGE